MLGSLISAGASLLGGMMANDQRADESSANREFQREMSNTSYQRGMEDMRKAGLNPMLAFSQGGASVPTGSMASFENPFAAASSAYAASEQANAANVSSQASASQAATASKIGDASVEKIKQEVSNLATDNDRLKAVTETLRQQYQNLVKEGYNLTETGNQIRATVRKLETEVPVLHSQGFLNEARTQLALVESKLKGMDVQASESLGNIGREAGQLAPILKILIDVIRSTNR